MSLTGECRCCRKPIDRRYLACWPHWRMLPKPLKDAIFATVNDDRRAYVKNVEQADAIWQAAGVWKPGVPMSRRADRGMETLRDALKQAQSRTVGGFTRENTRAIKRWKVEGG